MEEWEANKCRRCSRESSPPLTCVLHKVKLEGKYQALCSACVLDSHPDMYCVACMHVLDTRTAPPSSVLKCTRCPRLVHSSCRLNPSPQNPTENSKADDGFVCPRCLNPDWEPAEQARGKRLKNGAGKSVEVCRVTVIAATVASILLRRVAEAKSKEAWKHSSDAVRLRKEATDGLNAAFLVATEEEARVSYIRQRQRHQQQQIQQQQQLQQLQQQQLACLQPSPLQVQAPEPGHKSPEKNSETVMQNPGSNLLLPAPPPKATVNSEPNGPVR